MKGTIIMLSAEARTQNFTLTPEERASFIANGYFGPFTVCDAAEMRSFWKRERLSLLDRTQAVLSDEAAVSGNTNIANYDRHLDSNGLAAHITHPAIVDRAWSALGPDVLCWRTEFFPNAPGDEGTDWHQADTFANASGTPQILWPDELKKFGGTITVWTAFTDATEETGCPQFIPGTQEHMFYDETEGDDAYRPNVIGGEEKDGIRRGFFGYDYRELQIDPDWKPDESKAVSLVMQPGQAVMFWSTLLHASHPHKGLTKTPRIGFAARYVPTCVRVYPDTEAIEEHRGPCEPRQVRRRAGRRCRSLRAQPHGHRDDQGYKFVAR